ncbi:ROK family protein [Dactylosporangium sp. CA-139066]|uniref:ROK family protein n=1 Tax=Dactylosporangium sp. CA-139066 TaxID=3239930 RepID=UPI003D93084E
MSDADGLQLDGLRRRNAAAVLRAVRTRGPLSRTEIALAVGLSPTAVTKITADLVRAGFIGETRDPVPAAREPGRPRVPVELDRTRHRFVGVHIGLRRVTVGLVDLGGEVVAQRARAHGAATRPGSVIARARRLVEEVLAQDGAGPGQVLGYGACSGGWVLPETGVVRELPGLGWRDVALRDGLRIDGLPEPAVDSSVRALALAEARGGAAQGVDDVLYVFAGNVIGCAHVLGGRVARGRNAAAGTIDHLAGFGGARAGDPCSCGRGGCLRAVAGDAAVLAAAQEAGLVPAGALIEDLAAVARGDSAHAAAADALLAERARRIGAAIGALLDLFDPEVVVVGGGVRLALEHFDGLVAAAREHCTLPHEETPVRPAALVGPSSLIRGAAAPALDAFYSDPLAAVRARVDAANDRMADSAG